jgi:hypothetical protein
MWPFKESREARGRNPGEGWHWRGGYSYKIDGAVPHNFPPAGALTPSSSIVNRPNNATLRSNLIGDPRTSKEPFVRVAAVDGINTTAGIPKSEAEAREHIEAIRNEKGFNNLDRNVKDLDAALQL